jgi:Ni/Co efflux regulator RcnB
MTLDEPNVATRVLCPSRVVERATTQRQKMLKRIVFATAAIALAATAVAAADEHHDDKTVVNKTVVDKTVVRPGAVHGWAAKSDFRDGGRVAQSDWQRGRVIDYRANHLRAPPPGYEWREVNGQYVLAAVATGLIASIIMNSQ